MIEGRFCFGGNRSVIDNGKMIFLKSDYSVSDNCVTGVNSENNHFFTALISTA